MEKINILFRTLIVVLGITLGACTDYQYMDTGLAQGKHDCTVWEYLHTQSDDWDLTLLLIEHAGMKAYFDGSMKDKQVTFFGVTNLSILRFMLEHNERNLDDPWNKVTDIPGETCRHILERLIIPQRLMVNDVPRGNLRSTDRGYDEVDGKVFPALRGEMFVYTFRQDYEEIPEKGEIGLYIYLHNSGNSKENRIVSTDIQMTNGIVHALSYDFTLKGL